MTHIAFKWFVVAVSLLLAAYLVPGISVSSFYIALIVVALLGVLNIFIKPILILLTLPINIITLGLFVFVINGALLWFLATFIDGFTVLGIIPAIVGAIVVSAGSFIGNRLLIDND